MQNGSIILETEFGSILYGTSVPTSDIDIKSIYVPPARDILLQRVKKTIQNNTKKGSDSKNTVDDIDKEMFSLDRYIALLLEGQTVALDMLFAGQHHWKCSSSIWNFIRNNKDKLLSSKSKSFIGYAKQQADKYGLKGSRMGAVRFALEILRACDPDKRLGEYETAIKQIIVGRQHMGIAICTGPNKEPLEHLEVVGCKVPFRATVKLAQATYQRIFDEYGQRALAAETNQGIDWKSLMHAVRVCGQACELLATGNVTFPRPNRELLLQIRKGELPYKEVAALIEQGFIDLEIAEKNSKLPLEPNYKFAEDFVEDVYRAEIIASGN